MTHQDWVIVNVYPNIYDKALAGIFGGMPTYPIKLVFQKTSNYIPPKYDDSSPFTHQSNWTVAVVQLHLDCALIT